MPRELKNIVLPDGMFQEKLVEVVKTKYPKFDHSLLSKCKNRDKYGVQICKDGLDLIYEMIAAATGEPAQNLKNRENRAMPCRVFFRLTKNERERLQTALEANGGRDIQEVFHAFAMWYIKAVNEGWRWPDGPEYGEQDGA